MASALLPLMELPIVPLRTMVLFPHAAVPVTLNRAAASQAVAAAGIHGLIAVVTQAHPEAEAPGGADLYAVGTGAVVRHLAQPQDDSVMAVLEGLERIAIVDIVQTEPYMRARVRLLASERPSVDSTYAAVRASLIDLFTDFVRVSPVLPDELALAARNLADDATLTDMIGSTLIDAEPASRQDVLATLNVRRRMDKLQELIARELESLRLRARIRGEVQDRIAGTHKELMLREELRAIKKELGEDPGGDRHLDELRTKIEQGGLPDEALQEARRELDRLADMLPGSPEQSMVRSYVEWLAELPWSRTTARRVELAHSHRILDEDHFDLEKVKERVLEFLAVQRLRREQRGPLLCLVGPPGVGKTSIGRSIARATGRQFVRISLGGTNDEAEIRGHRRTYIGALPGQIIRGLRRAGSRDPVFMLDELDKLGRDHRGDPASALLEVLDPEQNYAFRDHYLDVPFDLSRVMFIATANVLDTIPEPLRDRMEVLEVPGYIDEDKLQIAQRYLVPKQVTETGLVLGTDIAFTDEAVLELVRGYTHEAGVRRLEQLIGSVCRKRARQLAEGATGTLTVEPRVVDELLGPTKFRLESQLAERVQRPGVAIALAYTPHGGEVLVIESTLLPEGKGEVTLTGHMGDVMQESARTAVSWVRANAARYGIAPDVLRRSDLHIHVPAGAVPKDGPSAGVVMATSLVSLLTRRPVRPLVAMTGEISLSGVLLPIGGVKEKLLAARRHGLVQLVLPAANEPDLREEVPAHLRGDVDIRLVATLEQAIDLALTPTPPGGFTMAHDKIQDVMTKQVHCVRDGASVLEVARIMRDHQIGDVLVTDQNGKLCGIVTDRDIVVRCVAEGRDLARLRVKDVCTPSLVTLDPGSPVDEAIKLMRDRAIRRIPVVQNDVPIGIVSIGDLAQSRDPDSALGRISSAAPNN